MSHGQPFGARNLACNATSFSNHSPADSFPFFASVPRLVGFWFLGCFLDLRISPCGFSGGFETQHSKQRFLFYQGARTRRQTAFSARRAKLVKVTIEVDRARAQTRRVV